MKTTAAGDDSLSAQTRQSRMDCYAQATVPKSADERSGGGYVMTPSPIVFLISASVICFMMTCPLCSRANSLCKFLRR